MAEVALMLGVDDVPEFSVDFHVRIVKVVGVRRVILLVVVIIIVATNRRFRRVFGEASVGVRAVIAHFGASCEITRGLLPSGRVCIILTVEHWQRRFARLFSVAALVTSW